MFFSTVCSICLSACFLLSVFLSVCLTVYLSVPLCLSVFLYLSIFFFFVSLFLWLPFFHFFFSFYSSSNPTRRHRSKNQVNANCLRLQLSRTLKLIYKALSSNFIPSKPSFDIKPISYQIIVNSHVTRFTWHTRVFGHITEVTYILLDVRCRLFIWQQYSAECL